MVGAGRHEETVRPSQCHTSSAETAAHSLEEHCSSSQVGSGLKAFDFSFLRNRVNLGQWVDQFRPEFGVDGAGERHGGEGVPREDAQAGGV